MAREKLGQRLAQDPKAQEMMADAGRGFALRKSWRRRGEQAWRQLLTTYKPEPWLVALARERWSLPIRPGHRPIASR